ncbi:hypothetical protein LTR95_011615, partial [Oleoguttula sp. CCFEE 5521]
MNYLRGIGGQVVGHLGFSRHGDDVAIEPDSLRAGAPVVNVINESGKRRRCDEVVEAEEPTKRLRTKTRSSVDAARLDPSQHRSPARDAQPLSMPTNAPRDDRRSTAADPEQGKPKSTGQTATARRTKLGGTFRPLYTLNNEPYGHAKPAALPSTAVQKRPSTPYNSRLAATIKHSDEIEDCEFKQQKMRKRPTVSRKQLSETIADPGSDDDIEEVWTRSKPNDARQQTGRHHSRVEVPLRSQRPETSSKKEALHLNQYFQTKESRNVDQHIRTIHPKLRRHNGSKTLSDRSAGRQLSSQDYQQDIYQNTPGTRGAPVELEHDLSQSASQDFLFLGKSDRQANRPQMSLDIGLDSITKHNLDEARSLRQARGDREHSIEMKQQTGNTEVKSVSSGRKQPNRQSTRRASSESQLLIPHTADAPSRLRHKFHRDEEHLETPASPARLKAKHKMQTSTHCKQGSRAATADNSADELCGPSTMSTRSRHFPETVGASTAAQTATQRTKRASPSDLKTSDERQDRTRDSAAQIRYRDAPRIRIHGIYCRACILSTGNPHLVWNPVKKVFYIESDDELLDLPNKRQLAQFGNAEVIEWISSKASTKLRLRGPRTENSMGYIFVHFRNAKGRELCHDLLTQHDDEKPTMVHDIDETAERFDLIWDNFIPKVQIDAQKCATQRNTTATRGLQTNRRKDMIPDNPTGDQILYEAERPPRQARPSRAMGEPPNAHQDSPAVRRSSRPAKPRKTLSPEPSQRWSHTYQGEPWTHPVLYPSDGLRKVTVDFGDIERLDEGEFLNDNLVGYALRRIEEEMGPANKTEVHFFNSFFFTSLMNKNGKKIFNYDAVKKWTKNKDLFTLPYVVVPINDNLHWYVAIICNLPSLAGQQAEEAVDNASPRVPVEYSEEVERSLAEPGTIIQDSQDPINVTLADTLSVERLSLNVKPTAERSSPGESAEVETRKDVSGEVGDDTLHAAATSAKASKKPKKRSAPPLKRYATDEPTIITFDSLGGPHVTEVGRLKDYVNEEGKARGRLEVPRGALQGMTAKSIPQQTNFCDCGLFLIGYVEAFAADPKGFIDKVLGRTLDPATDFAGFDPSLKRSQLREGLSELYEEQHR